MTTSSQFNSPPAQNIDKLLKKLWFHVSKKKKLQFNLLFILIIISSFAEIISIGAIIPFLSILTSPEYIFVHPTAQPIIQYLEISNPKQLLLPITIAFCFAILLSGLVRTLLSWANIKLSFGLGADLSMKIYRNALYQPYSFHISHNSSELITGISTKTNSVIYHTISPTLTLLSSIFILLTILTTLLFINFQIALGAIVGFGLSYALVIKYSRKKLLNNSKCIADKSVQVIKSLQEGLGGIRDVLIDGSQPVYCKIYRDADIPLRQAQGSSQFIAQSPRYGMEVLSMLIIAVLAYILSRNHDGVMHAVPTLGALALGAQRLLPTLQQAYGAWSTIQSTKNSLQDALDLLEQSVPKYLSESVSVPMPFKSKIKLSKISFNYDNQKKWELKNIDITIDKGSRIGFIGTSGSGKSTLIDIIMGLLSPSAGKLIVDNVVITANNCRAWQNHIAHVPQTIFLADSSIEENIAFGIPQELINQERIRHAAHQAQIANIIESWPQKYKTRVGERGVQLSGGQRQRIGIARALYKNTDVLILDEATSALDNETEQDVMQCIEDLGKDITVLIIAHRLSTLRKCEKIIELNNGEILRETTYLEISKDK